MSGDPLSDCQPSRQRRSQLDDHQSVGEFIEENYRLLTILGVLATLSLSFPQFQETLTIGGRIGVGSSLLLFGVVILVAFNRTVNAWNKAAKASAYASVVGYSMVFVAIIGLAGAMSVVVESQYAQAAEIVGTGSLVLAGVSVYSIALANWSYVYNYRPRTAVGTYVTQVPILVLGGLGFYAMNWADGREVVLASGTEVLTQTLRASFYHVALTGAFVLVLRKADKVFDRLQKRTDEWAVGDPGDPLVERVGHSLRVWFDRRLEHHLQE